MRKRLVKPYSGRRSSRRATHFTLAITGTLTGLGVAAALADRSVWRRRLPTPASDTANNRSSKPRVDPPRFIARLVHCSDGSPRLPACKETVLSLDSHRVSKRTRSCDLYSDMRCQTVVPRSIGVSTKEFTMGSLSKMVRFRGRKSVAENAGLSGAVGAVKMPGAVINPRAGGDERRKLSASAFNVPLAIDIWSPASASLVRTKVNNTKPTSILSRMPLERAARSSCGASLDGRDSGMADGDSRPVGFVSILQPPGGLV
jgi:hypothetical protein